MALPVNYTVPAYRPIHTMVEYFCNILIYYGFNFLNGFHDFQVLAFSPTVETVQFVEQRGHFLHFAKMHDVQ